MAFGGDFGKFFLGGASTGQVVTGGAAALGVTLTSDEAESGPIKTLIKRLTRAENQAIDRTATKDGVLNKKQAATIKKEAIRIKNLYDNWDFWIVFTAGFTPIPFKLITISAGTFNINLIMFMIASLISRSSRFFIVAVEGS
mgnify:CR=1 FL=1